MTLNTDTLAAAVKAYIDWQYRERGAARFTLTDLRAALLRSEAGGEGLHRLLMPPHPGDVYQSSALCSCGEWQWDGPTAPLDYRAVLVDYTVHLRSEAGGEGRNAVLDEVMTVVGEVPTFRNDVILIYRSELLRRLMGLRVIESAALSPSPTPAWAKEDQDV